MTCCHCFQSLRSWIVCTKNQLQHAQLQGATLLCPKLIVMSRTKQEMLNKKKTESKFILALKKNFKPIQDLLMGLVCLLTHDINN